MGQKSSKKTDLYVTDDVTHCGLPEDELNEFVGRAREYTTVNVSIEEANLKGGWRPICKMLNEWAWIKASCEYKIIADGRVVRAYASGAAGSRKK